MLRKNSGFTVIEVLIGIALFGVIMPSIIISVVNVSRLNDRAADLTRANVIAEDKFETLRSQGYNSMNNGYVDFEPELAPTFTLPRSAGYTISTPFAGVKEVVLAIEYTDQGRTRYLEYKTLISELGVAQ